MYFVYLLKSEKNGRYYIGHTKDLSNRLREHNTKKGGKYTSLHTPFKLVGYEVCKTKNEARWREHQLKKSAYQRKKFIKSLNNIPG
jgi:putative endonuclease